MAKAVFAGSFDPFTIGHMDVVRQAAKMFDAVYIVVAVNPDKTRRFHASNMAEAIHEQCKSEGLTNCYVSRLPEDTAVVDYAESVGAEFLIRGVRSVEDFMYEHKMAHVNSYLSPHIRIVYIESCFDISSSLVRAHMDFHRGWYGMVPTAVRAKFMQEIPL